MPTNIVKKNIVLLGDASIGKTSLIRRFVVDQFSDSYITTIGTKVTKKELTLTNGDKTTDMTLMVWDIIGQRGYRYSQSISFHNMHGALLVADLTRKETLDSLRSYWIPLLLRMTGPIPMIFLGNKADLESERQFDLREIEEVASTCTAFGAQDICYLASAKTGMSVEEAFKNVADLSRVSRPRVSMNLQWELMNPEEVGSLKEALDHIIADFSEQYGGIENATPVIKHQMELSELNLTSPSEVAVMKFIDRLSNIEICFKPPKEVEQNKLMRLKLFGYKDKK
ncbi:MAG: Rab family GTPase [Thermoplasmata archaeon]